MEMWRPDPFIHSSPAEKQFDVMHSMFWEAPSERVQILLFATTVWRGKKQLF